MKEIDIKKDLYNCCPLIYKECTKESCYINGGQCIYTVNYQNSQQYLIEENKRLQNIIKEVKEFVEWHYEDNKKFYKNKGIGLNYPECDAILKILDKGE